MQPQRKHKKYWNYSTTTGTNAERRNNEKEMGLSKKGQETSPRKSEALLPTGAVFSSGQVGLSPEKTNRITEPRRLVKVGA